MTGGCPQTQRASSSADLTCPPGLLLPAAYPSPPCPPVTRDFVSPAPSSSDDAALPDLGTQTERRHGPLASRPQVTGPLGFQGLGGLLPGVPLQAVSPQTPDSHAPPPWPRAAPSLTGGLPLHLSLVTRQSPSFCHQLSCPPFKEAGDSGASGPTISQRPRRAAGGSVLTSRGCWASLSRAHHGAHGVSRASQHAGL